MSRLVSKIKLLNEFGLSFQVVAVAFLLALVVFTLNLPVVGPTIQADEGSYLANASAIAGHLNDLENQYFAGYSLILSPAFWGRGEPSSIWLRVKLINAFLYFLTVLLLFKLAGMLKPNMRLKDKFISVLPVSLYPMWVCMAGYSFSENAFVPVFLLVCIAFFSLFKEEKLAWLLLGVSAGFLFWIHPKSAPVILAVLICSTYIAYFKKAYLSYCIFLLSIVLMFFFYKMLFEPWLHSRMIISGLSHSPTYPSVSRLLAAFASKEQSVHTLSKFGGHVFYITFATVGLIWVAFYNLFQNTFTSSLHEQEWMIKQRATLLFFCISFWGTLFLSVFFLSAPDAVRLDHWMYGRYVEGVVAPLLLIGILNYPKGKRALFFAIYIAALGALFMSVGFVNFLHTAPFNVSAFWQEFFLRRIGIGAWLIAGVIPIFLLYFLPRKMGILLMCLLFVFAAFLQIRWHISASYGASRRWEGALFVRKYFPKGATIGYDVKNLRDYNGNVYWFDFGFQLYDYDLKRISLDNERHIVEEVFFTFNNGNTHLLGNFFPAALSSHDGPVLWQKKSNRESILEFPVRVREKLPILAFLLQNGWHGLEKNHVWSDKKAELLIPIPEHFRAKGSGFIVLTVSVFAASQLREGLLLFAVEGGDVFTVAIRDHEERNIKLPFKSNKEAIRIEIEVPNAISPVELNAGSDRRTLGIALTAIDIEEAVDTVNPQLLIETKIPPES